MVCSAVSASARQFITTESSVTSNEDREQFVRLAQTLGARDGVEAIVLAGTDFAVMFGPENTPFPHVDCTRVHIDAIIEVSSGLS